MDYTLQKAVELGVNVIQPLLTERTQVKLDGERLEKRMAHWRGVIVSACEQSGRIAVPVLHPPVQVAQLLQHHECELNLVLDPHEAISLKDLPPNAKSILIAVGPEGGFSKDEVRQMQTAGFHHSSKLRSSLHQPCEPLTQSR